MEKILKNVHVLDMTEGIAGSYAASLLGDMGASVIKVERPEGDWARGSGKTLEDELRDYFVSINRNKRDLCLDLRKEDAGIVIRRLVEQSDVIISNYRKGVVERLGVGYAACQRIHPGIIYCTVSPFGQKGAYSSLPASDTGMQAISGIMDSIGEAEGPPLRASFPLVDIFAGSMAVQGILLGLYARVQGKPGIRVDVSLINAAVALQSLQFTSYSMTGKLPTRSGNQNPMISPAGAFRTKDDKYMTIAVLGEPSWKKFCQAIERPELAAEEKFKDKTLRIEHRDILNEIIIPIFLSKTRDEWIRILQKADVLCAPIYNFADIMNDSALCESLSLLNCSIMGKKVQVVGNPIEIDGEYPGMEQPACLKGEHTIEILKELGFTNDEIRSMLSKGIAFYTTIKEGS